MTAHQDVVIIGAGMAGLTLARHLLLRTRKTVLVLDKRADPPGPWQKVGESLVQSSGYYLAKVLDLEEHLLTEHFLKYNLRFHWKTHGKANLGLEDYSASFIRLGSNIPTFQLDRNRLERHLLELNRADARFRFAGGVRNLSVQLSQAGEHTVAFDGAEVRCDWVVDASGRSGLLKRQLALEQHNPIRHGATWCWVEGLVNIEKLTGRTLDQVRLDRNRRRQGHFPLFLATNHFCGEGCWFWVIPLHGKTSLGLVYEHGALPESEVSNARKMLAWVSGEWPLFVRDLPHRRILDEGRYLDFSYDVRRTIDPARWALTGEAGRFSDPLYSPGGDLIAIYNTLIVDAVLTEDPALLAEKCALFEQIMRVMYESYVPSYAVSYNCLGDQECFSLKYTWELAVYFGFFVLPFINDLFADREFMLCHLRKYALLGPLNRALQEFLSAYYGWKKDHAQPPAQPQLFDFYEMRPLRESEKLFYQVGLTREEAEEVLDGHVARLREFARYILAHVHAAVLGERRALTNAAFIASLKLRRAAFDPDSMRADYARFASASAVHPWNLNPLALEVFLAASQAFGSPAQPATAGTCS